MKGFLITSDGCEPCKELKEQFADLLKSGEVKEINFEKEPDEALRLMDKYEVNLPSLLILSDSGELILSTS